MAWKSGTCHENRTQPKKRNPLGPCNPYHPGTTEPDTHDRRARTTTDHSARTTTASETRTSTANGTTTTLGPGTRRTAADGNGATSSQRNPAALENLAPLTRSEMTSARTTETAHGNRWLLSCRWQEPAYPLCTQGLARVSCLPLRTPTAASPDSGSRESGRRRPRSILPVR